MTPGMTSPFFVNLLLLFVKKKQLSYQYIVLLLWKNVF